MTTWADFDKAPTKQELFRRELAAQGIVKPVLVVTDVALEEIPNGSRVQAVFAGRKESYHKVDGQWEETGFRKSWDSAWIIATILKHERAGEFTLEVPMTEWKNFQK